MPDETRSQDPPRDADPQRSPATQTNSISEQNAEMRDGSNQNSNQSATETKKLARELHWLEKANFAGQIILAVVGIVALVIYRGQLRVMQGTLDQMKRSGEATTQQMWSETRIAERAWMGVGVTEFANFEIGKPARIFSTLRNNGRTPAIDLVSVSHCEQWSKGMPAPALEKLTRENIAASMVRPDGGIRALCEPFITTQAVIDQLHSGNILVRTHGNVWYDDVFSHHHWMTFCSEYDYEATTFVPCDAGQHMDADPE